MDRLDAYERLSANRWREAPGLWWEDFAVGDVIEHRPGRTLSEADNTWFSLLTMNTNPLHVDAALMARTEWGRPLMNSCLTLAIVTGMSVRTISQRAVANLGWDEVRLPHPVYAGDTLTAESEVLEARPSDSRPGQGIVVVRTRGLNQDGVEVISFRRTVLVWRRGHGPEAAPSAT
jgi:itaconyl-CoA hydratase